MFVVETKLDGPTLSVVCAVDGCPLSDLARVGSLEEWEGEHKDHGPVKFEKWKGPHKWRWRVCPCGARYLEPKQYKGETEE